MGNMQGQGANQQWNIQPDPDPGARHNPQENNNMNRPGSQQLLDMMLNYAAPLMFICLFASAKGKWEVEKAQIIHQEKEKFKEFRHRFLSIGEDGEVKFPGNIDADKLLRWEKEEHKRYEVDVARLGRYQHGIENFLDIRCSPFQPRDGRIDIERNLLTQFADEESDLKCVISYKHLKDIFDNDYKFCGSNRHNNGKLRQLYMEQWRQGLEIRKYRNILKRIHMELGQKDGSATSRR